MSLSNPRLTNPCKKFIQFKGDTGVFQFWDKEAEKNIDLKEPVSFIVLDELCTISGFSDEFKSGIYSNEVRSLQDQVLNVRSFKGGLRVVGKYADIKGDIGAAGGKFCKSVYVALIHDDSIELANFQLKGIAFSAWLEKTIDLSLHGVTINKYEDGKKGAVKYKIPVYEKLEIAKSLFEKAIAMDKMLQEYLTSYQKNNEIEAVKKNLSSSEGSQSHPAEAYQADDDVPF